eukprot:4162477-Prorocentrum_lima.AAC.1
MHASSWPPAGVDVPSVPQLSSWLSYSHDGAGVCGTDTTLIYSSRGHIFPSPARDGTEPEASSIGSADDNAFILLCGTPH